MGHNRQEGGAEYRIITKERLQGVFFNSVFYDLAIIQEFFGIFEIGRTFFHSIHRRIFKNAKTLLIGQILV